MIAKNTVPSVGAALLREFALRANRGVQLTRAAERGLLARPLTAEGRPDPAAPAVLLPPVPAHALEYGANLLRHVWRVRGASAVLWAYVHPGQGRWSLECPPQLCAEAAVEADGSFKGCQAPDPELWLAGSLRSVPPGTAEAPALVERLLPPHHGVHFVLDLGRPLTCLTAHVRSELGVAGHPAAPLIDDPLDPALAYLSDRLLFRTRAIT